jgi:hypothetical protein
MRSSETSVGFQRTTRRYMPEDRTPYNWSVVTWSLILKVLISVKGFYADFIMSNAKKKQQFTYAV